ncbi:MAG: hypothetical protein HC857_10280 [Synechococcales cyanobacterium RU_4_20]|nr:hypothetical protein [Synechococcales cyanobacterium RU_4_20]
MTAKVLESFGGKLAEQWVATLLTPAFVFWLGGFAAILQRWGWKPLVAQFTAYPEPLQIALLVGGFCTIATSAFIVQRFDFATLRFLEGYGPLWIRPLKQWRIQQYRDRKTQLSQQAQTLRALEAQKRTQLQTLKTLIATQGAAQLTPAQRTDYLQLNEHLLTPQQQQTLIRIRQELRALPQTNTDLMPTRLGNILRAAERQPLHKYGLDAIICWSRLWMLLPDPVKKDLQEARADLNTAVRVWLWSLLFCGWATLAQTPLATWPLLLGLLSAWFAYRWAIAAAITYSDLLEATFDLYRHLLYDALRWKLPENPDEERRVGQQLTQYLWRGEIVTG